MLKARVVSVKGLIRMVNLGQVVAQQCPEKLGDLLFFLEFYLKTESGQIPQLEVVRGGGCPVHEYPALCLHTPNWKSTLSLHSYAFCYFLDTILRAVHTQYLQHQSVWTEWGAKGTQLPTSKAQCSMWSQLYGGTEVTPLPIITVASTSLKTRGLFHFGKTTVILWSYLCFSGMYALLVSVRQKI